MKTALSSIPVTDEKGWSDAPLPHYTLGTCTRTPSLHLSSGVVEGRQACWSSSLHPPHHFWGGFVSRNGAGSFLDSARQPIQNKNIMVKSCGGSGDSKRNTQCNTIAYKRLLIIDCLYNSWLILGCFTNLILNKWWGKKMVAPGFSFPALTGSKSITEHHSPF